MIKFLLVIWAPRSVVGHMAGSHGMRVRFPRGPHMKKSKKQLFLPLLLAGTVLVGLVLFASKLQSGLSIQSNVRQNPTSLDENSKLVDQDGLFIDYKNGLKFEYPKGLLESEPTQNYGYGTSKQFSIYDDKGNKTHWLAYGVTDAPTSDDLFFKIKPLKTNVPFYKVDDYEKDPKDTWPLWNYVKISNLRVNDLDGIQWYTYPTGGGEGEMSWGYTATFEIDGKLITLSVFTNTGKSQLDTQKKTFESMVSSLSRVASK